MGKAKKKRAKKPDVSGVRLTAFRFLPFGDVQIGTDVTD